MIAKVILVAVCLVAAGSAVAPAADPAVPPAWKPFPFTGFGLGNPWALQANPWIPPWVAASWMPRAIQCDPLTGGSSCNDCTTRVVCSKFGGLLRACTHPDLPYCYLGQCVATPSAQCAPAQASPAPPAVAGAV